MAAPKSVITDAELEVLKALWDQVQPTAKEITETIYGQVNLSSTGTVQKLIARLEEKGIVLRDRGQIPHRFTAKVSREDVAGMQLNECARKLSAGSLSPFVLHLVHAKQLSKREKDEIRRLLDEE